MTRSLTPLFLTVLAAGVAHADPSQTVLELREGKIDPAAATTAWEDAGITPDEAIESVRNLRRLKPPRGDHVAELTDPHGRTTDLRIVMPKDGPDDDGNYRVLMLLHGLGGKAEQATKGARGLVPEHTILVAPSALPTPDSMQFEGLRLVRKWNLPVNRMFPNWWSYQEESFPLMALEYTLRHYPIDTNRVVLSGYSMGGFGAWNIGLRYHDRFAGLLPLAGGIAREEYAFGRDQLSRSLLDNAHMVPCFFVHGGKDEIVPVNFDRWTSQDLEKRGIPHTYEEVEGARHVMDDFKKPNTPVKKRLSTWVAERVRDPHPKRVVHRLIGSYHASAYWVRVDDYRGNNALLEAEVQDDRATIHVKTEGVAGMTLFLDRALVDVEGEITIVVDGQEAFRGKVEPSLEAVAQSYARSRDPELTYQHKVTIEVEPRGVKHLDRLRSKKKNNKKNREEPRQF